MILIPKIATNAQPPSPSKVDPRSFSRFFWPVIDCHFEHRCHICSRPPAPSEVFFRIFWPIIKCDFEHKMSQILNTLHPKPQKSIFFLSKRTYTIEHFPLFFPDNKGDFDPIFLYFPKKNVYLRQLRPCLIQRGSWYWYLVFIIIAKKTKKLLQSPP